jgi:hypothetical protein
LPPLAWLVNDVPVYAQPELPQLASTCFRYGLNGPGPGALDFSPSYPASRTTRLATLPGLWPMHDWRLVSGPDVRPEIDGADPDQRRLFVFLELQFWWGVAFRAAAEPEARWAAYHCAKLIAEPARILLWLELGEQHLHRVSVLRRALATFPEESVAIEQALDLAQNLDHVRVAPLAEVLPSFVRLTTRIVDKLTAEIEPLGVTAVRLEGTQGNGRLPLCDWRALVRPPGAEERFVVEPGRADDVPRLAHAIADSRDGRYVTLLHDGLIVRPVVEQRPLRSIGFGATDPVSAALTESRATALYPDVPGWSARDTASRAVAEHGAWLRTRPPFGERAAHTEIRQRLGGTFAAARAALFLNSLDSGEPSLPVTFAATAAALAEREPGSRGAIEAAYESYTGPASVAAHEALVGVVGGLPGYRRERSTCQ